MKPKIMTVSFCIFTLILVGPSLSQTPGPKINPRMRHWKGEVRCGRVLDLNLASDQIKEYDQIHQAHLRETQLLRTQLLARYLELRESFTNPNVNPEFIRLKYEEIAGLEFRVGEKAIDYLLKLRNLLTQEQLKNWCPEKEFPFKRGMGHGPGMTDPLNFRRPPFRDFD
jgi:hypothetical protein